MNEEINWLVAIHQNYSILDCDRKQSGKECYQEESTQIAQLHIVANSAQEAIDKAEKWLKESKIPNAYVSNVCVTGILEVDIS